MAKIYLSDVFNGAMRAINSLLGLLMVVFGSIWILQGLNIAFLVGFMVNDKKWALYGAILALVGLGELLWANTRAQYHKVK